MLSAAECSSDAFIDSSGLFVDGIEPVVSCPFDAHPASERPSAAMQTALSRRLGRMVRSWVADIGLVPEIECHGGPLRVAPQSSLKQ